MTTNQHNSVLHMFSATDQKCRRRIDSSSIREVSKPYDYGYDYG